MLFLSRLLQFSNARSHSLNQIFKIVSNSIKTKSVVQMVLEKYRKSSFKFEFNLQFEKKMLKLNLIKLRIYWQGYQYFLINTSHPKSYIYIYISNDTKMRPRSHFCSREMIENKTFGQVWYADFAFLYHNYYNFPRHVLTTTSSFQFS